VRMVVSELRGEKIDIIPYNEEPARFVAKALSPARVREVLVDDDAKQATVIVPDDQLSLAIGREGQNARLAAKLTGWRVDIKSETEFSQEEELEYEEEEAADGRCAAVLSAGRRCPNASLAGSRFCGLPQHQALSRFDTSQVTVLAPLSEAEVAILANPDAPEAEVAPLVEKAKVAFSEGEAPKEAPEPAAVAAEAEDIEERHEEREQAEDELAEAQEAAEERIQEAEEHQERVEEEAVTPDDEQPDEAEEDEASPSESTAAAAASDGQPGEESPVAVEAVPSEESEAAAEDSEE
jgi:N utilization substance protein A